MKLMDFLKVANGYNIIDLYNAEGKGKFLSRYNIKEDTIPKEYMEAEVLGINGWYAPEERYWGYTIAIKLPFDRNAWIDKMVDEYYSGFPTLDYVTQGNTTLVFDYAKPTKPMGWSKCNSKKDKFSGEVGLAVAYARFRGYEIPEGV